MIGNLARTWVLWICVVVANVVGIVVIAATSRRPAQLTLVGVQHWLLMSAVVLSATALTAAPCIAFLLQGWRKRLDEFKNSIRQFAISAYLQQFWERRLDEQPVARTDVHEAEKLFDTIYVEHYGRRAFAVPVILLLATTFISAVLVVQTGIDTCVAHACVSKSQPAGRFAPLGDITLPGGSVAAIGGAYLFVVGDLVRRARWRTLTASDVSWYVLRQILAIPIGLAFIKVAAPNVAVLVAFGLGAFPLDTLLKQLLRLTNKAIGSTEEQQEPDQLLQLDGVTVAIATELAAEGIESIDELVGTDPVLLSIRSGVPFASVLRFASQAVVRIHFGSQASKLTAIALGNAYLITELVAALDRPDPGAQQRLSDVVTVLKADAAATIPSEETVKAGFKAVAAHGYTKFLRAVADA